MVATGIDAFVGSYSGETRWRNSLAEQGTFDAALELQCSGRSVTFRFGDGHVTSGEFGDTDDGSVAIHGETEGVRTEGTLFVLDGSLVLEYVADVGGRVERNTDVWMRRGETLVRAGVIRQEERTIWFESEMTRQG